MVTFEGVLEKVFANNPRFSREKITRAFEYAKNVHNGQYRLTGDPYITHSLAVTDILLSLHPDEDAIITALLHGVAETPHYNLADIEERFGVSVARLLSAYITLLKIKFLNKKTEAENLRKMFLVMAQDLRVVLIKLSDRLHNMMALDFQPVSQQKHLARETLDIYVPISARLGIYTMKVQLEDLCFKYLYKQHYEHFKTQLHDYLVSRGRNIDEIKKELAVFLKQHGIKATVEGRIKNLYSIYKKLKMKSHATLDDVYDIFAMRIILSTRYSPQKKLEATDHLYAVLGLIHGKWSPAVNRFKDYVAVPKPNGYKSLHTAVVGLSPKSFHHPTEIQIRSRKMHEEAEYGIASHWIYEDTKRTKGAFNETVVDEVFRKNVDWLNAMSKTAVDMSSKKDLVDALKLDVFTDRIFVLTPTGEVKDLPRGSTPIDFAYAIHSDMGHHCQLAKVNGAVVPLNYELQNGEVVEIVQNSKSEPKPHWLSFVKTVGARTKIRSYFRSLDKTRNFSEGKEIINKILARTNKPLLDEELSIFRYYNGKKYSFRNRVGLVEEIGNRLALAATVLKKVFGADITLIEAKAADNQNLKDRLVLPKTTLGKNEKVDEIFLAGESGVPYRLVNCCKPVAPWPIAGYVTRGSAVSIHLQSCKVLSAVEQARTLEASWGRTKDIRSYPVKILLKANDRVGLIRDIVDAIVSYDVNIVEFANLMRMNKEIICEVVLEIASNEQFRAMLERLQRVRGILEVKKAD